MCVPFFVYYCVIHGELYGQKGKNDFRLRELLRLSNSADHELHPHT